MLVTELTVKLPKEVIESATIRGIKQLTPPQEKAIAHGLLDNRNVVIAAPTASGKTFIAEMAMLKSVMWKNSKAVYVAPMRALVSEKFEEFRAAYPYLKVAMSIGDMDSLDPWLEKFDIIFASTEKLDSLIRHGVNWLESIGCIVFDEIHMIDDAGRGPTLEILITRLRRMSKQSQLISLSATIGNAQELSKWLSAELVESDYRPVPLEKGIVLGDRVYFKEGDEELAGSHKIPEIRVTEDTLHRKKQLLLFYSTKRNTEAGAEKLKPIVEKYLTEEELTKLAAVSDKVLNVLGKPTAQCEKLSKAIRYGVAFHHSGLVNEQRRLVENAFRDGLLKAVCSTTTLGLGVNLPAHTVVVRDTTRYSEGEGAEKISINEVVQLFGRAGRPKYDKEGRALLLAKSRGEVRDMYERYMNAELEPITSKLGVLPILRSHVLAFVASHFLRSYESIVDFLGETFYGHQYANRRELGEIVERVLAELVKWMFIEKHGSIYAATRVGQRVSELYIDPLSARWMLDVMPAVDDEISGLFMICNTLELRPYAKVVEEAEERFFQYEKLLSSSSVNMEEDSPYYDPIRPFSTALLLNDWILEKSEPDITKKFAATPGTVFVKINNADWMLYSAAELARLIHVSTTRFVELRVRVKYGIKKELLDLTRLEQVGRVRARAMYDRGIKRVADLRKSGSKETVEGLFGKEIAKKIMDQIASLE